jgi:hypothetical protein
MLAYIFVRKLNVLDEIATYGTSTNSLIISVIGKVVVLTSVEYETGDARERI